MDTAVLLYDGSVAAATALSALALRAASLTLAGLGWLGYVLALPLRLLASVAATLLAPIWIPLVWAARAQFWVVAAVWTLASTLFHIYGPAIIFGGAAGIILAIVARTALRQNQWVPGHTSLPPTPPQAALPPTQQPVAKVTQSSTEQTSARSSTASQERRIARLPAPRKPIRLRGVRSVPAEDWKFLELGAENVDPYSSTSSERDTEKSSLARARAGHFDDSDGLP